MYILYQPKQLISSSCVDIHTQRVVPSIPIGCGKYYTSLECTLSEQTN